jgi:hypothetical protein
LVDNLYSRKFNWAKADQEEFERILREEVLNSGAFNPLRLARLPSEEEIENAAEALEKALVFAAEQSVPLRRPSAKAQPWWEGEVLAVRDVMTQARLAEREGREFEVDGQPLRANTAINHFKYKSKKAKQNYYKKIVAETTSQNIWDRHRWVKSTRQYFSPPIRRAGQDPAVEHSDKCDALRAELFPPPADLDVDPPDLSQPLRDELPCPALKLSEVRYAIFSQNPRKAPGPDGITFQALRWAWNCIRGELFLLLSHCHRSGYHPRAWRRSITAAIRKPNKPDYSKARAYRPIALLICMSKVLEKLQTMRLTHLVMKHQLMPHSQFGAVAGKSTVDAGLAFVHDVEMAKARGLVTSSLTFDITGFFDFVNHARLICILREKKIPTQTIKWVKSFLSDRSTAISLDGMLGEMKPVNTGLPQGSSFSPLGANLYTSKAEPAFEQSADEFRAGFEDDSATLPGLRMFVDDGKISVASKSLETKLSFCSVLMHSWRHGPRGKG